MPDSFGYNRAREHDAAIQPQRIRFMTQDVITADLAEPGPDDDPNPSGHDPSGHDPDDGLSPAPMVGPEVILRTNDLTLRYGSNLAVDRLNLTAYRGEIYGFLGRNGAGKTSTIRMIMGIGRSDSGTIQLGDQTLRRIGNAQKRSIGYVSQEQFFYPWMTCQRIGKFVRGLFPTWDDEEFSRLLDVLHLPPDRKVAHLSGGMKVKLGLALALAHRPEILILDEPTAGLDPVARREFQDIIRHQARQYGRTTFFSSHLIDEVQRVADRVGIIHRGRMRFEGPLDNLLGQVRQIDISEPAHQAQDAAPEPTSPQSRLSTAIAQASAHQLQFLRRGLDDPDQAIFQGPPSGWAAATESGLTSSTLTLEDAFIALASDEVRQL